MKDVLRRKVPVEFVLQGSVDGERWDVLHSVQTPLRAEYWNPVAPHYLHIGKWHLRFPFETPFEVKFSKEQRVCMKSAVRKLE